MAGVKILAGEEGDCFTLSPHTDKVIE